MHIGAYANRLTPIAQDWELATSEAPQEMRTDLTPEQYYSDFVSKWVNDYGASIIGGCCGITPEHIAYLHSHLPQDQT
jgi:homocysteine S-methyltransferase